MDAQTCKDSQPVVAFAREAQAALDQVFAAGFRADGWTEEDFARAVAERAECEQDIREVTSVCCAIVKGRRDAGWAADLSISRETLDHAIRQALCGRSVYYRVVRPASGSVQSR